MNDTTANSQWMKIYPPTANTAKPTIGYWKIIGLPENDQGKTTAGSSFDFWDNEADDVYNSTVRAVV